MLRPARQSQPDQTMRMEPRTNPPASGWTRRRVQQLQRKQKGRALLAKQAPEPRYFIITIPRRIDNHRWYWHWDYYSAAWLPRPLTQATIRLRSKVPAPPQGPPGAFYLVDRKECLSYVWSSTLLRRSSRSEFPEDAFTRPLAKVARSPSSPADLKYSMSGVSCRSRSSFSCASNFATKTGSSRHLCMGPSSR